MDVIKKLSSLQEISKTQLSKILCSNPNKKYLILEPSLIRSLERVCGVRWLKDKGVEKIFKLEPVAPSFSANSVVYMIYPEMKTFKQVVDQIRSQVDIENIQQNKFHIIVVPRLLYMFEDELEYLGLYDTAVKLHSFIWMPIHLDTGILSLELRKLYSLLFVYENYTFLPVLSKILWQLCFVVGKPNVILALGQFSNALLKQYDDLCEDKGDSDKIDCDFGALVIVDRSTDYASALLTPGTYSALLNEVYPVNAGVCDYKQEATEKLDEKCNPVVEKLEVNITLDSTQDSVYADIKNRYFTEVTSVLSNLTKQLKSEKVSSKEMALDEIKRYVQTQLQASKSRKKYITNHLMASESIINVLGHRFEKQKDVELNIIKNTDKSSSFSYLEEIVVTENDKFVALRLFCLLCITQKLSDSEIKSFWRKFLHQFGFSYGFAFNNLTNAGFVSETTPTTSTRPGKINLKLPKFLSSNFYINAKNLRQIPSDPDKVNLKYPTCASYVFGGAYIPLITQIASLVLNSTPLEEVRSKLEVFGQLTVRNNRGYPLSCRSVLIYVIGGVTYAEIAACNLIESLTGGRICILSDTVINGNDIVKDILDFPK